LKPKTTWREKLEKQDHSKIVEIPERMSNRFGHGTMLIPRPLEVDSLIRRVRKGKLVRPAEIRQRLAVNNGADVTCPLTTGIFIRIAAEAAEEDRKNGKKNVTPYWRVIRDDGTLYEKFPGGVRLQAQRLTEEGHRVEPGTRGRPPRVADFEKRLIKPEQL